MGVHTGDSITLAPAMTLTDAEFNAVRDLGIAIIREVGLAAGGCNIRIAIEPQTGRMVVIEMNPRVSRSSALASKATGVPIAKVTTMLAVGYTLDEIQNDMTGLSLSSGDPAVDYVVVKVPRFAFEKFPAADDTLTTTMKSVGEAMSLGRNFTEALQKAMRSLDTKGSVFHWEGEPDVTALLEAVKRPTQDRIIQIQQALRGGANVAQINAATDIDPLFLDRIALINEVAEEIVNAQALTAEVLARAKRHGFSDRQIGQLRGISEVAVREVRWAYNLHPVYKMVDTCAGTLEASTPYMYSTYDQVTEVFPREKPAVLILGSGPNRIGQGLEFDYSCVQATFALEEFETIIVNCNPETVSTDYDISDRLYFEPLTLEDVLEVYRAELLAGPIAGVIVQLGGQTPLALAKELQAAGCRSSARRRRLSTWPKTASCLAPCLRRLVCKRRSTGRPYLTFKRSRLRNQSATRCSCVRRTSWAGAVCRSCTHVRSSKSIWLAESRKRRTRRATRPHCSSTVSSTTPQRSTSTPFSMATSSSSAASCSTSKRPAFTPAILRVCAAYHYVLAGDDRPNFCGYRGHCPRRRRRGSSQYPIRHSGRCTLRD
ncbi:hypothetical protein FB477_000572 [Trueperella pyogenes]|nr:hypothetical protein [Trueperella pyogenes]